MQKPGRRAGPSSRSSCSSWSAPSSGTPGGGEAATGGAGAGGARPAPPRGRRHRHRRRRLHRAARRGEADRGPAARPRRPSAERPRRGRRRALERVGGGRRVAAVLPRRSLLARADPHVAQRRRAIAANIDLVVVVVAAEAPPLHPRLIDRYLVAVEQSGARPALVVNKIDLPGEERRHEILAAPAALPVPRHTRPALQRGAGTRASKRCARRWPAHLRLRRPERRRQVVAAQRAGTAAPGRRRAPCATATGAAGTRRRSRRSTSCPAASA